MEFTTETALSRSLVRRLAPWTAALGLFSGGGYGVYHYAAPVWQDYGKASEDFLVDGKPAAGQSDNALAKDEIRQLFAAPADATKKPTITPAAYTENRQEDRYGGSTTSASDRYSAPPAMPPAVIDNPPATTSSASDSTSASSPTYGDRYGASQITNPYVADASPQLPAPSPKPTSSESRPLDLGMIRPAAKTAAATTKAAELTVPAVAAEAAAAALTPKSAKKVSTSANPLRGDAPPSIPAADAESAARSAFGAADEPAAKPLVASAPPREKTPARVTDAGSAAAPGSDAEETFASAANSPSGENPIRIQTEAAAPAFPLASASNSRPIQAAATSVEAPTRKPSSYDAPEPAPLNAAAEPLLRPAANSAVTPTPGLASADGAGRPGELSLEGVQSPVLKIQKLAPAEIQVGKKCTFAVRITNAGAAAATNVEIRDEVPLGTQLVGTAPKAAVTGSHVLWDLGTLSPGEERTVEMELVPTDEGDLGSVATVSFAAAASAKSRCTRPELALRLTAGPKVLVGEKHLVEVEVSNPGTGVASGVMLMENVPEQVTHEAGPALEFEVGTLQPGESRRLELVLTAEKAGAVTNTMIAKSDGNLSVESSCEFEVVAPALEVAVAGPQRRYLERPATYTVSVNNPGTAPAKDVQLVTQLPKGLRFVSANNMGEYDAATHSVYWSLAELPASEEGKVELTAVPIETGEQILQVASRAQQGLEDRTEARVTVDGLAALSFEVKADDQMVEVGGATTFDVRVTNEGSKAASNVQVVAVMPAGLRASGGSGDAAHTVEGDRVIFAPLAQLPPKGEAKFRVEVQGLRAGDQRLRVEVTSDDVREPIIKQESTRVYADE